MTYRSGRPSCEATVLTTPATRSYIVVELQNDVAPFDWFYLGTRIAPPGTGKCAAISYALQLTEERRIKHDLASVVRASKAMRQGIGRYTDSCLIKKRFHTRAWGTGAVIVVPNDTRVHDVLRDESHAFFTDTVTEWVLGMKRFAEHAQSHGYNVKLTPDFDGNRPNLRWLFGEYLCDHSAGILSCGKSSYTTTGLIASADAAGLSDLDKTARVVVVGYGNLGHGVLRELKTRGYSNLAVCDLQPNVLRNSPFAYDVKYVRAMHGTVARQAVAAAEFVFITIKDRHAVSNTASDAFKRGSTIIVGANQAISRDKKGDHFLKCLRNMGVRIVLGPIATLGGPMTATAEAEIRRSSKTVTSRGLLTRKAKNMIHTINRLASTIVTKAYVQHVDLGMQPWEVIDGLRNGAIRL